jgi:hypothetical protein
MGLFLYLVGLLALVSGASHIWRQKRRGQNGSPFAIAEISVGVMVVLASAMGLSRWGGAPFVVVLAMSVVAASVVDKIRLTLNTRRRFLASEAERLESHIGGVD